MNIFSTLSEGPWSVAVTEVDGERTNTMEYEAKVKGEEWVNHAYEVKTEYANIFMSCFPKHRSGWSTLASQSVIFKQL